MWDGAGQESGEIGEAPSQHEEMSLGDQSGPLLLI
jgi:hypothetical protein